MSKTCGECAHWSKFERPVGMLGGVALGSSPRGECRVHPPQTTVFMLQGPGGQTAQASQYPNLPDDFPACGCFVSVEDLSFKTVEGA